MRVWLLHPAEPVPFPDPQRLFRYGTLSKMLAEQGHQATQWASTFDHFRKEQRSQSDHSVEVEPGYNLELLSARPYRRHVGLTRILSQRDVAKRFRQRSVHLDPPDVIVVSLPTLELAEAAIDFAMARRIPVIVDIRDLWPDVFLTAAPQWSRRLLRLLLAGFERQARAICRRATLLTGVSESYLKWGLAKAGREKLSEEQAYYLAYPRKTLSNVQRAKVHEKLSAAGVGSSRKLRCCFMGTLGRSAGVNAILQIAERLQKTGHDDIEFVICGRGPREQELQEAIKELPQVRYLGWLNADEITGLMERSDIGLAVYEGGVLQSVPNKPVEYLAGGLSVLTTLTGELGSLLRKAGCGASFEATEINAMSDWIIKRRQNRRLLDTERSKAVALFEKEFDANRVYGQMIEWIENVSSTQRGFKAA